MRSQPSDSTTVIPIDTATNTAGTPIPIGTGPPGGGPATIAITPDGKTAYVLNYLSATVTPISTRTNTTGPTIPVGTYPHVIAITPPIVPEPPAFTSGTADTAAFGSPSTFTVTTTGIPIPAISRKGRLPSGMRFTDNRNRTATISGTPANGAEGLYPLTFTAKNEAGTATQAFTLTVTRAPSIKKVHTIRAREGAALNRAVRAIGYPAPALAESGPLPAGLSFTDNGNGTAVITGTPANGSSGRYRITITATNASGTTTRPVTLLISPHRASR
jgi:YVTN family beta-propeller protein